MIKVEQRAGGDFTREYDHAVHGMSSYFVWLNRNKESLTLDLKHPAASEVLERLLAHADVVLQNLAPGAAHRLGIGAADIVSRFPRAIAVDISGYGVGGPFDEKRAYDLLIQAEGAMCSITGLPGAPAKAGPPVADMGTGLYSLSGILAALYARERSGAGAVIRISMFDVVAEFMGFALQFTRHTGEERQPIGMGTPMVAPYGAYPTADAQTVVLGTTNDREWQRLALQVMDRPDLAADRRFATNVARCNERAVLDEAIGQWTRRHALAHIQAVADAAGIGNARYNTVKDVLGHPQLDQRDRWHNVDSPVGPIPSLLDPLESDHWPQRLEAVPALGEHTDAILAELGYSAVEIAQLRRNDAV